MVRIRDYNRVSKNLSEYSSEYHYISNLINSHEFTVYESMTPSISVKNYLDKSSAQSVCICENYRPVGLITKQHMDAAMSGKYGYAVFSNRPISKIMDTAPLIVDAYTPINVVAKGAMARQDEHLYDDIIVTKSGRYLGLVSMKRIIEYTLMYEKTSAKERNPLTGLPGNPVIARVLSDAVDYISNACILYIDINEFKIYNDVYGFEKGDFMIKFLADMLVETVKRKNPHTSFIGHVGGDDFIVMISGEISEYHCIARQIIKEFEANKALFFTEEHFSNGMIEAEDRFGIVRKISLTSLSIAGIYGEIHQYKTSEKLSEALAALKKQVKKKGHSAYELMNTALTFELMA